jgi:hypothetical protein
MVFWDMVETEHCLLHVAYFTLIIVYNNIIKSIIINNKNYNFNTKNSSASVAHCKNIIGSDNCFLKKKSVILAKKQQQIMY